MTRHSRPCSASSGDQVEKAREASPMMGSDWL
jgi:hypothetical protein